MQKDCGLDIVPAEFCKEVLKFGLLEVSLSLFALKSACLYIQCLLSLVIRIAAVNDQCKIIDRLNQARTSLASTDCIDTYVELNTKFDL